MGNIFKVILGAIFAISATYYANTLMWEQS